MRVPPPPSGLAEETPAGSATHLGQRCQPRGGLWVPHVRLGGAHEQRVLAGGTQGSDDAVQLLGVAHLGRTRVRVPGGSGVGGRRSQGGPHLGARAVGFDVLEGGGVHPGRCVQGAEELLLSLSRGERHACGRAASAQRPPAPRHGPPATAPPPRPPAHSRPPTLLLEAIGVGASAQDGGVHPPGQGLLGQQDGHHSL